MLYSRANQHETKRYHPQAYVVHSYYWGSSFWLLVRADFMRAAYALSSSTLAPFTSRVDSSWSVSSFWSVKDLIYQLSLLRRAVWLFPIDFDQFWQVNSRYRELRDRTVEDTSLAFFPPSVQPHINHEYPHFERPTSPT